MFAEVYACWFYKSIHPADTCSISPGLCLSLTQDIYRHLAGTNR